MQQQAYMMEQTMRWYGPNDVVTLRDIRQAGCSGVVSALHQIPVGEIWTKEAILERKQIINDAGLDWTVVESLPVHDDIKRQSGDYLKWIENYKISLQNLGECGLKVITYNFMPVLDWIRTVPDYELPSGARTLYFHRLSFLVFDLFLLKRPHAVADYSQEEIAAAQSHYDQMSEAERQTLFGNILLGLPGSDDAFTPELVHSELAKYANIDTMQLKAHLSAFLNAVVPVAEEAGLVMAIHPDDPPYAVLGLPRIVSTDRDLYDIVHFIDSPANGLCFCTGSLGARPDNDLPEMMRRYADRIHFLHFRNTARDAEGNFREADHLDGDTDMAAIVKIALEIMQKRAIRLPMRPDHGYQMLDDLNKKTYPGYSAIGRLKGLAELRGLERGLAYQMKIN